MDENKKKLDELKKQYDQIVGEIQKLLKHDDSKTLVEYQQKMQPLLAQKDAIVQNLNQMYQVVKVDFENQRKQIKAKETEIKKQAQAQRNKHKKKAA